MNYSPKDTPWNFDTTYEINSYKIEFKCLRNFAKEGPLCGQLYINNKLVNCPMECDGFGGPPLITQEYIYTPVYQRGIGGFFDIDGGVIAEINLRNMSVRIIGEKYDVINIAYIKGERLYFYDSCIKGESPLRSVGIKEGYKPWTLWDKLKYTYYSFKKM